jgi:hypothetical protein
MLAVALSLWLVTTPPPIPPPSPPAAPALVGLQRRAPVTLAPPSLGLYFTPLSLFALSMYVELDLPLVGGLDLLAIAGGGALGQLGGDLGLRYYVQGTPLDGFYAQASASVFTLPAVGYVLLGPTVLIGHGWRIQRIGVSASIGFTAWSRVASSGVGLFNAAATDVDLLLLPGIEQPKADLPAIQPAIRVSIGPWF